MMRRMLRGLMWAVAFLLLCWLLTVEPTWRVLLLVCACSIVEAALDELLLAVKPESESKT